MIIVFVLMISACKPKGNTEPKPIGPLPTPQQIAWHEMEYYAFVHFNMNTFTDMEWGYGDEKPETFNPSNLDCRQWVRIFKEAGMKGVILTAKHHDGFCLWPSAYTEHSVKNSPWKNGEGDVIQELRDACDEYGLKLGLYLSPWDRNHPDYGRPEYIEYFHNQLKEILTNYGDIFEVWFDGANGGDGYYGGANEIRKIDRKTYYNWDSINKLVLELQPNTIIFSDKGPGCRWIGNERGYAGKTCWATLDPDKIIIGGTGSKELTKLLNEGDVNGTHWIPGETNVSIRPGWYYHPGEDEKVKSLEQLLDNFYSSIGRGTTWLLNIPVDNRGLVHENDSAALMSLRSMLDKSFRENLAKNVKIEASNERSNNEKYSVSCVIDGDGGTYWTTDENVIQSSITLDFGKSTKFNRFLVQEYIQLGQRIKSFQVEAWMDDKWTIIKKATTIGYKRILRFPMVESPKIRFTILDSKASPVISNIEVYKAPELISNPLIIRGKNGMVNINCKTVDPKIYYTLDGTEPNAQSALFSFPLKLKKGGIVKAIAMLDSGEQSEIVYESFDVCPEKWSIHSKDSFHEAFPAENAIDGNPNTMWHTDWGPGKTAHPHKLEINLGEELILKGFTYTPRTDNNLIGVITKYNFYFSEDGLVWKKIIANGEFSNIRNNPVKQEVRFNRSVKTRFIGIEALGSVDNKAYTSVNEIGVITK
jgi:alpha-L-fucosidase